MVVIGWLGVAFVVCVGFGCCVLVLLVDVVSTGATFFFGTFLVLRSEVEAGTAAYDLTAVRGELNLVQYMCKALGPKCFAVSWQTRRLPESSYMCLVLLAWL